MEEGRSILFWGSSHFVCRCALFRTVENHSKCFYPRCRTHTYYGRCSQTSYCHRIQWISWTTSRIDNFDFLDHDFVIQQDLLECVEFNKQDVGKKRTEMLIHNLQSTYKGLSLHSVDTIGKSYSVILVGQLRDESSLSEFSPYVLYVEQLNDAIRLSLNDPVSSTFNPVRGLPYGQTVFVASIICQEFTKVGSSSLYFLVYYSFHHFPLHLYPRNSGCSYLCYFLTNTRCSPT